MEEKKEKKRTVLKKMAVLIKPLIKPLIIILAIASVGIGSVYVINKDTFKDGVIATGTYTSNAKLDPGQGIVVQKENEDGTTSEVSIEEILEQIDGAGTYLKDDEESTKEEKLQYLMNAELVTKFPYISSLEGDESKLNGTVKFYRYTNQIEAADSLEEEDSNRIEIDPKEIFYIGDSWMVGLNNHLSSYKSAEYPGEDHFLCLDSQKPTSSLFSNDNLKEKIDKVAPNVSTIVIMLGLNGTDENESNRMNEILDFLSSTYSDKTIYFLEVPHVCKEYKNGDLDGLGLNRLVDQYNSIILEHCSNIANTKYIDVTSNMMTEDLFLSTQYANETLYHLNYKGYELWYENIIECIETGKSSANMEKYQMRYVTEEEFEQLQENYKTTGDREVYKCFTLNEKNEIVVAYGRKITQTITTDDPEQTLEVINEGATDYKYTEVGPGVYSYTKYVIQTGEWNYQNLIKMYSMPFNLLWAFLVETKDYALTSEIANLAYDSEICIGIYDNESLSTSVNEKTYNKYLRYTENTDLIFPGVGQTTPSFDINSSKYSSVVRGCHGRIVSDMAMHSDSVKYDIFTEANTPRYDGNLYGYYITEITGDGVIIGLSSTEQTFKINTTMTTVANITPTVGVISADIWLGKWMATYGIADGTNVQGGSSEPTPEENEEFVEIGTEKIASALLNKNSGIIGKDLTLHSDKLKEEAITQIVNNTSFSVTATTITTEIIQKHLEECKTYCQPKLDAVYGKTFEEIKKDGQLQIVSLHILRDKNYTGTDNNSLLREKIYQHVNTAQEIKRKQEERMQKETFENQLNSGIKCNQWPTAQRANINIMGSTSYTRTSTTYDKESTTRENEGLRFKNILNKPEYYESRQAILNRTEWFWEYIRAADDTAVLEDILRYMFNIAFDTNKFGTFSESQIEDLFNSFEPKKLITLRGIYGKTVQEKIWYALRREGYSEYAVAGVLGNIWAESGFLSNNLENSAESRLGYTDVSYTEAINNDLYSREQFISDSAGYGLAQWTSSGRKAGLYDFAKSRGVSIDDVDLQIEYLIGEITYSGGADGYASYALVNYYKGYTPDDWINAESPEEAAAAFCWVFERPAGNSTLKRENIAREYYEEFQGRTIMRRHTCYLRRSNSDILRQKCTLFKRWKLIN